MSFIQTILAFLAAILLLVSLHELGHLVVARLCGIKVRRFSVGFGVPFFKKTWRNIEWCLAPIPLGGYVKMVDTREGEVNAEDLPYAFDKQHPLKRIAVVAAGPLTNLVLAVILYGISFGGGGVTEIRPVIGTVYPQTIAQKAGFQAGDTILSVNGKTVSNFTDAQTQMVLDLEAGQIFVQVNNAQGQHAERIIDAAGTPEAAQVAKRQTGLGMSPFRQTDEIGVVQAGGAADRAGLKAGDKIVSVNGVATPTWQDWAKIVRENAGAPLNITYERAGEVLQGNLLPESRELPDKSQIVGFVGLSPAADKAWAEQVSRHYTPSWGQAMQLGWQKMTDYATLTAKFFWQLITGNASLSHISGPVTIADVAGQTVRLGWQPYVEFLALVSISLGVMNLLPVPVLDGGHLVFYTWELLRGKPLSERVQAIGLRIGVSLMLAMMVLAFFNDITRLFG